MCASSEHRSKGHERNAYRDYGMIAPAHVRRRTPVAWHSVRYNGARELGRGFYHVASRIDDGGDPRVGCAQHVTPGFDRARLRDLQVLSRRDRTAEPRDVAYVDEHRRLRQLTDDLFSERIFVTDVDRNARPRHFQRLRFRCAAREVLQRDRERTHDAAQNRPQRNELAKRHQMELVVALWRGGAERDHAVVVAAI